MGLARRLGHNAGIIALAAALLATTAAEGLYRSGVATRIEYLYTDLWHRLAGPREAPRHTALVMLDDPTLNERPDEPLAFWTPHFAKAVATLRQVGVKVVAIDFIFSGSPERWIEKLGLKQVSDLSALEPIIDQVIDANAAQAEQYRAGKDKLIGFFVGQVMKASGGKANPAMLQELIQKKLKG